MIQGQARYNNPIMTEPANIFPKSLTEIFKGFASSPTTFKGAINGKGEKNPLIYPHNPFCFTLAVTKITVVSNAKPTVVFKSAVGVRNAGSIETLPAANLAHGIGKKEIIFAGKINKNKLPKKEKYFTFHDPNICCIKLSKNS